LRQFTAPSAASVRADGPAIEAPQRKPSDASRSDPGRVSRVDDRRTSRRRRSGLVALLTIGPLAIGVALAGWAIAAIQPRTGDVHAKPAEPMHAARSLADCASCHPRQAQEWSRSVMAHAITSPLFQSLEALIEEQVGRDRRCPDGAGVLRTAGADPCRSPRTGIALTGSGGALWCVNCHSPGENIAAAMPPWDAHGFDSSSRRPLRDLLPASTMEGIGCAACHQMTGPVHPGDAYEGNPSWISADTGARFTQRPEDARGVFGIANSGYSIDLRSFLAGAGSDDL